MRLFGWSGGSSGCQAYRLDEPWAAMAAYDPSFEYDVSVNLPEEMQHESWSGPPEAVVVMQRASKPNSSKGFQHLMRLGSIIGVCEYDDSLWNIDAENIAHGYYNKIDVQKSVTDNIARAAAVTVSTRALGEQIVDLVPAAGGKVRLLPNCLPEWAMDLPQREHHDGSKPVRIAYPASANHTGDAKMVGSALKKLLSKYPGKAEVVCVGADFLSQFKIDQADGAYWTPWYYSLNQYYSGFSNYDIVIAPLDHIEFNEAKSDIKALEAWRGKVPVVASNWGPYKRTVTHEKNGMLVDKGDENGWFENLRELVFNHDRRIAMGLAGRQEIFDTKRVWTYQAPMWANLYHEIWKEHS